MTVTEAPLSPCGRCWNVSTSRAVRARSRMGGPAVGIGEWARAFRGFRSPTDLPQLSAGALCRSNFL